MVAPIVAPAPRWCQVALQHVGTGGPRFVLALALVSIYTTGTDLESGTRETVYSQHGLLLKGPPVCLPNRFNVLTLGPCLN